MNSSEIRNTFFKYFEKNNHKIIHSSSLVPENDPTLDVCKFWNGSI